MDVQLEIREFSEGVHSALEVDEIPNNALTSGWNTAFRSVGKMKGVIGVRPGLDTVNDTALSGTPAIHRIVPYNYDNGTTVDRFTALVGTDGKLYYKESDDTIGSVLTPPANYPYASGLAFTAGATYLVDGAVMNNSLFLVNTNGERRSLIGETYKPFGLSPIATFAPSAAATGSASMPAETYDVAVTTYDSASGEESSRSTASSVTLTAGQRIKVDITPTSAETAQYEYWRIYLRRQTTQAQLYKVLVLENVGGSNVVTDGNIPIATTTVYVDLSSADIANLIIQAPSTTENNQPLTSCYLVEAFAGRLLMADERYIYWSNLDKPRGFPPNNKEQVITGKGDEITGLHQFSDDICLIFTRTAVFGLFGDDPQNWVLKIIDPGFGCVSQRSIVGYDKKVGWWSESHGPVEFDGQSISQIHDDYLGSDGLVNIEPSRLSYICAGHQPDGDRVLWYFTKVDESRNGKGVAWNYRLGRWESDHWDAIDASSLATCFDADGLEKLFLGGYSGQLFKFNNDTKNDGIVSGTTEVTWTPAASTTTLIPGTGFYNSNGKLVERKITILNENLQSIHRARITSNTSTELTVTPAPAGLAVGSTYTVYIGGRDMRIYTKWYDFDIPFQRKRVDRVYLHGRTSEGSVSAHVGTHVNFNTEGDGLESVTVGGVVWDSGVWDTDLWAGSTSVKRRLAPVKACHTVRFAFFHHTPDEDFILVKLAALARVLDDRVLE